MSLIDSNLSVCKLPTSIVYPLPNMSKVLNHNIKEMGVCELWG
jgi:hypothetical protein